MITLPYLLRGAFSTKAEDKWYVCTILSTLYWEHQLIQGKELMRYPPPSPSRPLKPCSSSPSSRSGELDAGKPTVSCASFTSVCDVANTSFSRAVDNSTDSGSAFPSCPLDGLVRRKSASECPPRVCLRFCHVSSDGWTVVPLLSKSKVLYITRGCVDIIWMSSSLTASELHRDRGKSRRTPR